MHKLIRNYKPWLMALILALSVTGCNSSSDEAPGVKISSVRQGPQAVNLGTAGSFEILAKAGISTTGASHITGDMGVSPIAATAITGFNLVADATNQFSTSTYVGGQIYAANYASPTPAKMSTAVSDMEAAYTDAAGRTLPDSSELGAGNISGMTLAPGLYKWSSGVSISNVGVTLAGGPDDVWIFQIAQNLTVASDAIVRLTGGAQAKNVFWQVSGKSTLGTAARFKGNILCQTLISLDSGAQMVGRALAQSAVTLIASTVIDPTAITLKIAAVGPQPVDLGTAGNFEILAKTGISTTGTSEFTGNIGVSPIAATAITGFGLVLNSAKSHATSTLVNGKVYAADYLPPTPAMLTLAVSDMEAAYVNAAGRTSPDFMEKGGGDVSGMTLAPGLYKWSSGVVITRAGVTLSGGPDDVWIFQIAQNLTVNNDAIVRLTGGALAKNIFWQVSGQATIGTASQFKGNILSKTLISLNTSAQMIGRALAQTAVTLNSTTISDPTTPILQSASVGPQPVDLGTAGNYEILAKSGISTTGASVVTGDMGVSPVAATGITGFGLVADASNQFSTSSDVNGKIYAADYAPPTPAVMTKAVSDMEAAFTNAAGRTSPDFLEQGAGDISGLTLAPGLYKWSTGVTVSNAGVTLSGGPNDVWIFQIAQGLTVNSDAIVRLTGGAQAKNIFWQVSGQAAIGTAAKFKGNILSKTLISLNTGSQMVGRALAQTAVTLNATTISSPVAAIVHVAAVGLQPVNLGTAADFEILAKSGISTAATSTVTGDMGVSPAAASAITGFGLIMDPTTSFSTSSLVSGKVYAASYAPPSPAKMTAAVSDMEAAFTEAAGRPAPDKVELGEGNISGMTIAPGLYKWSTGLLINEPGVTLTGGADDVWIFQIAQNLTVGNSAVVRLTGGAQAKNIFWQVSGKATLGTAAQFQGNILCQTLIAMESGARMTGRALAQTAVTLTGNTVTNPSAPGVQASSVAGPQPVALRTAGNFEILAKSGISSAGTTVITGDIGVSPIGAAAITGFALAADTTNTFSTSTLVNGKVYASDHAVPTPAAMTAAIGDMEAAYTDAAGRTLPDFEEKGAGDISGMTLTPGLYKWSSGLLLTNAGVTLAGGPDDVWIFQVAQGLTVNNDAIVTLSGGAQAKNIFWQVAGQAAINSGAKFKGTILGKTMITMKAGSELVGRAFAQTAVTLTAATLAAPSLPVLQIASVGPLGVNLGSAGNFEILAKSGISTTGATAVTGDIGVSPIAASAITGFSLVMNAANVYSTSPYVNGKVYASGYAPPAPATLTAAVSDMEAAFTDAAGRTTPNFVELGAGNVSGMTLTPGLYKWSTGVLVTNAGLTLAGGANDSWIFQIANDLTVNNNAVITLSGGAQAKNITWQVSGQATIGTAAKFKGNILSQTMISLNTGAEMSGRALAQTAVTLNATTITAP